MGERTRQSWKLPSPYATPRGTDAPRAPRVLLVDEGFMSGAQTAVGLRDAGCTVTILSATGGSGGHAGSRIAWSAAPRAGSAALLDVLAASLAAEDADVVYPVTEPLQAQLASVPGPWTAKLWPRLASWQHALLGDKRRASDFAAAHGVPIPTQRDVLAEAVDDDLRALGLPVVVKGIRGRGGSATHIAGSIAEARAALRRLAARGVPAFLQELVRGETWLAGGVFDAGRPLRWYTGVKRVQHPPRTGPAAVIESAHEPALDDVARRLFAAFGVSGLASADFIRDSAGRFLFLELNPRPWGSIAAAREAEVDLFTPLAALIAGRSPAADLRSRPGVRTTVLPLYLLSASCWRRGIVPGALLRDLRGAQGTLFREPGQALHLVARLLRVWRNWR